MIERTASQLREHFRGSEVMKYWEIYELIDFMGIYCFSDELNSD